MKKILILSSVLIIGSNAMALEHYSTVRFGLDGGAKYTSVSSMNDVTLLGNETKGLGGEYTGETFYTINDYMDLGFGGSYQTHSKRKDNHSKDVSTKGFSYDSMPFYLTTKIKMPTNTMFIPYVKMDLGYSINLNADDIELVDHLDTSKNVKDNVSMKNGLYWGIGLGTEIKNFTIDLMYKVNKAKSSIGGDTYDSDYWRTTLSVGYMFN